MAPGRQRIVILGGGICSLATAFELTSAPDWQEHYEITLYQMGWRLGGKAASGRDQRKYGRIEEHGFHFWWGFYENAFTMLRRCYDAVEWPAGYPITTWDAAFRPIDAAEDAIHFNGVWHTRLTNWPTRPGAPGAPDPPPLPSRAGYVARLLELMIGQIASLPFGDLPVELPATLTMLPWWRRLWEQIEHETEGTSLSMGVMLLKMAHAIAAMSDDGDFDFGDYLRFEAVSLILKLFIEGLWLLVADDIETSYNHYVTFVNADYLIGIIRGLINDKVIENGFSSINHLEFRTWLSNNGVRPVTLSAYVVNALYDMAFCFEDGDYQKPNVEAGSTAQIIARMLTTYRGSYMYYMDASMADLVITPLYLALRQRGVKFEFFHRVSSLHVGEAGGPAITAVSIGRQVDLRQPYEPLVQGPDGILGWPSEPLYDQIVDGDRLGERITLSDGPISIEVPRYDLESRWTEWRDVGELRLEYGKDYDLLVLGISLGSMPVIAAELISAPTDAGRRWREMVAHVKTNQTQALQIWLDETYAQTGFPVRKGMGFPLLGEFDVNDNLVDTWADMTHVLRWEGWPAAGPDRPADLSYFIGVLKDETDGLPPPDQHDFPHRQLLRVGANSLKFLRQYIGAIWPKATAPDGPYPDALDWSLLIDPEGRSGEARFNYQFWRANIDPSERYVLSVAGSTKYRMRTDDSGYHNLYLTGDWIFNGANVGFVDGATTSAFRTAQAITLRLLGKAYPEQIYGWDEY